MKLLFATANRGKLAELHALVQGLPIEVESLAEHDALEVVEDGATLEVNALKKARAYFDRFGLAALADDTGLCVDALGGAPGVRSARFAFPEGAPEPASAKVRDEANNARLLAELAGRPDEARGAEFRCALCLVLPGRAPVTVHGVCRGRIARAPRGANGFGYDPLFEVPEFGRTLAEMAAAEKNRISHRARAFAALRPHLERLARGRAR
jgi:XTP/dITP diphosphohydrolase